eukprot:TRINITY_DN1871_c0_g1_i3.p1 TRINITY_DN1871_c0_g1~~TRINITY_DN1871_c0_g1_i3.p1  ORF type:complete len:599 (-),score=69.03 TRINITY_DN1871_c0_g1_i3:544-2298(-)
MSVHNGKPPKLQSYGKQLDTLKISGWADNYICYASLKSALGEVACTLKTSEEAAEASPSASSHFDRNKLQAMTASFFAKLEDELEKVSDFHHELTLSAKRTYRETKAYVSPILARIHSGAPVTKEDHDKLEKMMGSMMEAHQQLTRIQHFGHINEKGFYKIMTKYNHMFQQTDDALIFLENLGSADFVHTRHHIKHIKSDILGLARNIEDAWRRHAGSRGVDSPDERGSDDEGEADRSLIGSVLSPRTSELNDSFADLLNNHRRGVTGSLNSANGVYNDDGDEEHVEFQIQPREEPWETLARYESFLSERSRSHLGYPYNLSFRSDELRNFLRYSINNLGDPFVASNYGVHSRVFEVAVLKFFADLWKIGQDEFWGYVTTCGTEGNLHAILVAREVLPDAILYSSTESHYSVFKAARFYRMDAQPISTTYSGQLNLLELEKSLLENKDRPAIINCNVGTTVKGAVDDVDGVIATLHKCGYTKDRYYIHCDGALFALMLPFCGREAPQVNQDKRSRNTDLPCLSPASAPSLVPIISHDTLHRSTLRSRLTACQYRATNFSGVRCLVVPLSLVRSTLKRSSEMSSI